MPKQRLFTLKSGMGSMSNDDTTHYISTCRFTRKIVLLLNSAQA